MSNEQTPIIPSTLKFLLNDWVPLRAVISEITLTRKQRQADMISQPSSQPLLTDVQIHEAFYGPYHPFVQQLSQTYALLGTLRMQLVITQDDNIKPYVMDNQLTLPKNIKTDLNAAALDKLQIQLNDLVKTHFEKWQKQVADWQQQLIMQLTMHDVNLSDLEIDDLSQPETLAEVIDRFIDSNLSLPTEKSQPQHFEIFFRLKAILCLHSAFSRQMKAHDINVIEKTLKPLKDEFKQMKQETNQLTATLKQACDELTKNLFKS